MKVRVIRHSNSRSINGTSKSCHPRVGPSILGQMTLTFISWCSFATNILFWLPIAVPKLACNILDETSDYLYFFGYQLLLYFLSGFWYGLWDGMHGVNLVRRQVRLNSTEIYTRAVRREIILRGMTQLYRAGLTSDRYLLSPGPACVFVFILANVTWSKVVPVGVRFFTWIFDSSVKPIYDYVRRKVKKPPDGYLTQFLCFNLICLAFARFGFTVYARILGVRLGISKLAGTSRRRKLSRKIAWRRPWIYFYYCSVEWPLLSYPGVVLLQTFCSGYRLQCRN